MKELLRDNIANLVPYSCARNDFKGEASVYLDANENWQEFVKGEGRNRYPDPLCTALRKKIELVMGLGFEHTVIGNGSDEIIDNLIRMFCTPRKDKVLLMPPTYGAYRVFCDINDVKVVAVPLTAEFGIDFPSLKEYLAKEKSNRDEGSCKLLFICSPNNPSGNAFSLFEIQEVASLFEGITVIDEAYFDFNRYPSAVTLLEKNPNMVVLRTLSKSWALANARIGILVASLELCQVMRSMKYPYNISGPAQELAIQDLDDISAVRKGTAEILKERPVMASALKTVACVKKVYPSDANFFLVKVSDANALYQYLKGKGIIVRNRTKELNCENCLRITIGSALENKTLLQALKEWDNE